MPPDRVAAIVIEPVQGEGGFYVAPPTSCASFAGSARRMASCSSWTRFKRRSAEPGECSLASTPASSPISSSWQRASLGASPCLRSRASRRSWMPPARRPWRHLRGLSDRMRSGSRRPRRHRGGAPAHARRQDRRPNHQRLEQARASIPDAGRHIGDIRGLGSMIAIEFVWRAPAKARCRPRQADRDKLRRAWIDRSELRAERQRRSLPATTDGVRRNHSRGHGLFRGSAPKRPVTPIEPGLF